MKRSNNPYFALLAIVADMLVVIALFLILPRLVLLMRSPSGWSALLVIGAFSLFVAGVFTIRRLQVGPDGDTDWLSRGGRAVLALLFALAISLAIARQLGFFESGLVLDTQEMGEGGSASYFVFGPGAWLAFSLLYVLVFAFRVTPAIDYSSRAYFAAALFALVVTDAMLVVFTAQLSAVLLQIGAAWWWAILALAVLSLMFLPPRLLYLSRTNGVRSPEAYAALAVFLVTLIFSAIRIALMLV